MSQASTTSQKMSPAEAALLKKAAGESGVLACVPTETRVDVGLWWRWRKVWLCLCADRVVLLADGPRPFCQSVRYSELGTTFYSHRSGELVLVPAPGLTEVRSLLIWPDEGWELLCKIRSLAGTPVTGPLNHLESKDRLHASTSA